MLSIAPSLPHFDCQCDSNHNIKVPTASTFLCATTSRQYVNSIKRGKCVYHLFMKCIHIPQQRRSISCIWKLCSKVHSGILTIYWEIFFSFFEWYLQRDFHSLLSKLSQYEPFLSMIINCCKNTMGVAFAYSTFKRKYMTKGRTCKSFWSGVPVSIRRCCAFCATDIKFFHR